MIAFNELFKMFDDTSLQTADGIVQLYAKKINLYNNDQVLLNKLMRIDAAHDSHHYATTAIIGMEVAKQIGFHEGATREACMYHDVGLVRGRENHHIDGATILSELVASDAIRPEGFNAGFTREDYAYAAETHRKPMSLVLNKDLMKNKDISKREVLSNIVRFADRVSIITPVQCVMRCPHYGYETHKDHIDNKIVKRLLNDSLLVKSYTELFGVNPASYWVNYNDDVLRKLVDLQISGKLTWTTSIDELVKN